MIEYGYIMGRNTPLLDATIHYNSTGPEGEEEPEGSESSGGTEVVPPVGDEPSTYYVYRSGGYEEFDVSLEECLAKTASSVYNPQLAHMLMATSFSVKNETDLRKTFANFGFEFEDVQTDYSLGDVLAAYGMAKKQVGNQMIVWVALRGTDGMLSAEMWDNLGGYINPDDGHHAGFAGAASNLLEKLSGFLGTSSFSNITFVITGFSRGAAVTNILAARLIDQGAAQSNVYAYAFACPDTTTASYSTISRYQSIFNIADVNDFVSWSPSGSLQGYDNWGKYGCSYWYSDDWNDYESLEMGMGAHGEEGYLNYLRAERTLAAYKNKNEAKGILDAADIWREQKFWDGVEGVFSFLPWVGIHCPVDVEVYASGLLVGSVTYNLTQIFDEDKVNIFVSGDEKDIYLLSDDTYTFRLTATGAGTMEYFVQNINVETREPANCQTFENVSLQPGKRLVSVVTTERSTAVEVETQEVKLYVLNDTGEAEKEVLSDGKGTEVPLPSGDTPDVPDSPDAPDTPDTPDDTPDEPDTPVPPSQPSGGTGTPSYAITASTADHGAVSVSPSRASYGDIVTITLAPDEGYELETLAVTTAGGDEVEVRSMGDDQYTFTMPRSRVSIEVTFAEIMEPLIFTDVPVDAYYYDAVYWAVENGVTNGTSATTFSPDADVTRAQMVTFLWRAYGSPQATGSNPFTDVSPSDYYYDAVLWAVENGVTNGTSATTFSPETAVTRSQAVTFQWRAAGSPATSGSHFDDVTADAYYADAVAWAVTNGITHGTGGNLFSPDVVVSRAQAVTFLFRELA